MKRVFYMFFLFSGHDKSRNQSAMDKNRRDFFFSFSLERC